MNPQRLPSLGVRFVLYTNQVQLSTEGQVIHLKISTNIPDSYRKMNTKHSNPGINQDRQQK